MTNDGRWHDRLKITRVSEVRLDNVKLILGGRSAGGGNGGGGRSGIGGALHCATMTKIMNDLSVQMTRDILDIGQLYAVDRECTPVKFTDAGLSTATQLPPIPREAANNLIAFDSAPHHHLWPSIGKMELVCSRTARNTSNTSLPLCRNNVFTDANLHGSQSQCNCSNNTSSPPPSEATPSPSMTRTSFANHSCYNKSSTIKHKTAPINNDICESMLQRCQPYACSLNKRTAK